MLNKIEHYLLHFLLIHLAMTHHQAGLGHDPLHQGGNRFDGFDPVMN